MLRYNPVDFGLVNDTEHRGNGHAHGEYEFHFERINLKSLYLPEWLRTLIIHGKQSDHTYPSRSEAGIHAICELIRLTIDDSTIKNILLDPQNRISDHFYDQNDPQRAFVRALAYAHQSVAAERTANNSEQSSSQNRKDGRLTQDRAATQFARDHQNLMQFDHHRGRWYIWTGNYWECDEKGQALNLVRQTCRRLDTLQKPAISSANAFKGVETLARTDPRIAVISSRWDSHPEIIATPGKYIDLRTGKSFAPEPSLFITQCTSVTPSIGKPERWTKFLREVTGGDQDFIRFLQQIAGYCLTGLTSEQCLFFFFGLGGTGKSTFVNTLLHILKGYAAAAPMETFTASKGDRHPTELAMLRGKRIVTATETEQGRAWAESRIKQLTGGDPISARFMRKDFFEFTPEFKLVIVGNHQPSINSCGNDMRRRFYIIPFDVIPKVKDPNLIDKLKKEWPQILNWAIDGCFDWHTNGLVVPEFVQMTTDRYFEEQDIFNHFLETECRVEPSLEDTSHRLYASWKSYCNEIGEKPGSSKSFGGELRKAGFRPARVPVNGKRRRGWSGLRVLK